MTPPHDDPLDRRHVTEGSTDVLPAYPTVFILVGLLYAVQPSSRTSSDAFDTPKLLLAWTPAPIRAWGVLFLVVGVLEAYAWCSDNWRHTPHRPNLPAFPWGNRRVFRWCLIVGAGIASVWGTLLLFSALWSSLVTLTGAPWLYFVAWCHKASEKSLRRDKVLKP